MNYYITMQNEQKGPYSRSQIEAMWNAGAITADALFCTEGTRSGPQFTTYTVDHTLYWRSATQTGYTKIRAKCGGDQGKDFLSLRVMDSSAPTREPIGTELLPFLNGER